MRRAAAYFRVSTEDQKRTGFGLDAQQITVTRVACIQEISVVKEFFEIESGRRNDREILKEALQYCEKYGLDLIFAKVDRFARDALFVAGMLINSQVKIIAADKPHATKLDLLEDAIRAQREAETISQRTKDALAAAKLRGVKLGTPHTNALAMWNRQAALDFAEYMRPLIERYQQRGVKTVRATMKELNRRKIPTFRKRGKWHITSVHALLQRIACSQNLEQQWGTDLQIKQCVKISQINLVTNEQQ